MSNFRTSNAFGSTKYQWGGRLELDQIDRLPIPEPTATYQPVPQGRLYKQWAEVLDSRGYSISSEEHWASNLGDVFLSKVTITSPSLPSGMGFRWQVALINSYNRQVSIKTAVGAEVFVCTNGCLSAEQMMRTKHTSGVWNRMFSYITRSVDTIGNRVDAIDQQFRRYLQADASNNRQVDHVVCEAYRNGIIPASGVGGVLDHWRTPEHPEFRDRNVWSLYNAFTSYERGRSLFESTTRINRLHSLLNREFSIEGQTPQEVTNSLVG